MTQNPSLRSHRLCLELRAPFSCGCAGEAVEALVQLSAELYNAMVLGPG